MNDGNDRYEGRLGFISGRISLGHGDDVVLGGTGNETIDGGDGGDVIDGGDGVDTAVYELGGSHVIDLRLTRQQNTGEGLDTLIDIENVETTGGGNDHLIGNGLANVLRAYAGIDSLDGGMGDDTLDGGEGNDAALFSGTAGATVDLRLQGTAQDTGYGFDTLTGIETLVGGAGDDRFIGDGVANLLSGSGGNDILEGGSGDDTLDGGAGVDTAVFSGARAAYQITPDGAGGATVVGPDGTDVVRSVRFLQFADGVMALTNAAPTNLGLSTQSTVENAPVGSVVATLLAQDADGDRITYSLGAGSPFAIVGNSLVVAQPLDFEAARQHSVVVQAQDDYGGVTSQTFTIAVNNAVETTPFVLRGGAGADGLQGEAGHDTLYGGAGRDLLAGGAGQDVFVFDTRPGSTNVDSISDFSVPQDSIWLDNAAFGALGGKGSLARPQKLASDAFVSAARAQDREDRIVYDKKSGKLYYDQDGTGSKAQVHIATLSKALKMTAGDFFVI
ncbi:cadherin domain-containing protein [Microvirga arsenatis]|uniref:cadherin domain-containing protein n=1 Tax=Microvirga arsenatis TaxID=2692265 RepID=UPI001378A95A|nr:cadherin domain-containing protein [Microvirga arsenatis]